MFARAGVATQKEKAPVRKGALCSGFFEAYFFVPAWVLALCFLL
jgi:hypothetical protein